ncbi:hypothetical protein [Terracidiphilus gabretensis]|uniref:hypothetical protein n=1 Tax=Terracidiphilus gabretensis TaxID=1577687 RepID=UPI00071BB4CB|nr:hypothetical protein [Terracidiphilus gabretensis]
MLVSTDGEHVSLLMKSLAALEELQLAWDVKTKHNLEGPDNGATMMLRGEPMRIADSWTKDVAHDPSHLNICLTAFLGRGASSEYIDKTV